MTNWEISSNGLLTITRNGKTMVTPSPLGLLVANGCVYAPEKADVEGNVITLSFSIGQVLITVKDYEEYSRFTLTEVTDNAEHFIFGPYRTKAQEYGELVGAAWYADGSGVCIQSLMPKVVGGLSAEIRENNTGIALPGVTGDTACLLDGQPSLLCTVSDMTTESTLDYLGMHNVIAQAVPGPDGEIEGGAIALLTADNADDLLSKIGQMEINEGMPHPCIDGSWAKTDKRTSGLYLIVNDNSLSDDEKIELTRRAGSTCIYFSDPFTSWGHFEINTSMYPGGKEEFTTFVKEARERGVDTGFHTLSNFIHTSDPYVTPVPHERLLVMDRTSLTQPVGEDDTELFIADTNNFSKRTTRNFVRIGDELIFFGGFDAERLCLTDCVRGACHTAVSSHENGAVVSRLWDHGYGTLFPDIVLQNEMAETIGRLIRDTGIRRMSFDGLEGCAYTGRGEYACSEFTRRVFNITGNEVICDASMPSHYRWHAHSYFNWGEPWYDEERRGGMHEYRANHIPFFRRNLMPGMMGWYCVYTNSGRYEATSPETMEFMLSRMAAFDAGLALSISGDFLQNHGKAEEYIGLTRLWEDFRMNAAIPNSIREKMQDERSNWHLEKTADGWQLTELTVHTRHLDYCEQHLLMESGTTGYEGAAVQKDNMLYHASNIVLDRPKTGQPSVLHFRIRVGEPGCGHMENPVFSDGYYAQEPILGFELTAEGGDYLEYNGGTTLLHYDKNYNLKAVVEGTGKELAIGGDFCALTLRYTTPVDDKASYEFTTIRPAAQYDLTALESAE